MIQLNHEERRKNKMNQPRIFITLSLLLAIFAMGSGSSSGQCKSGDEITITGEVVDANCYMHVGADGRGESHKMCAVTCANAGSPLAILTSDGTLYYPIVNPGKNPNEKLMDYIAENVVVKGKYFAQGPSSQGIVITTVEKAK
jgi:hypothetical protein